MSRKTWQLRVSFATPAFLGGADQSGEWRTPPFKALLRQWWRVVYAAKRDFQVSPSMLRANERALFGGSAGDTGTRSRVCLRMDWRGRASPRSQWPHDDFEAQSHPETNRHNPPTDLYLFYGAVGTNGAVRSFIEGSPLHETMTISVPDADVADMEKALLLANWFGTLGGRSRNGAGSVVFASSQQRNAWDVDWDAVLDPANRAARDSLRELVRNWRDALGLDWIHAVGRDDRGLLIWRTKEVFPHWTQALDVLAKVKIAYRTMFHFRGGGRHNAMCDRHVLAYPITNHRLFNWQANQPTRGEQEARLANQMIMKVHRLADGRYVGLIAHLPHGLPAPLKRRLSREDQRALSRREQAVWEKVHQALDGKLDDSGEIRVEGVKLGELLERLE